MRHEKLAAMLRVDQAGEYGARRIYEGQLAVFARRPDKAETAERIREMAEHEQVHLDYFDRLVVEHNVRPTLLSPLWHIAGFALGAGTALLGEKAAMACTEAVETEIDAHYAAQLDALAEETDAEDLRAAITTFRAEENEHKRIAEEAGAGDAPEFLRRLIRAGCRTAIALSRRL